MKLVYVLTWTILSHTAFSWDTDDLELFDLVEEVNRNFYDVLGVPSVSDLLSIKAIFQSREFIITIIPTACPGLSFGILSTLLLLYKIEKILMLYLTEFMK